MREMQRNYRKLINRVKQTRQPLYLGARLQKEAVLVDLNSFTRLVKQADRSGERWKEVKKTLDRISRKAKNTDLVKILHADRRSH